MKLKCVEDYIRFILLAPTKLLKGIKNSTNAIKRRLGLSHTGWDDDWSFLVFIFLFIAFICFSLYY